MFALFAFTPKAKLLAAGFVTGLVYAASTGGLAAQQSAPPDFSSNQAAWLTFDVEFRAVPGGPSPVRNDPAHPRVSNAEAARTGKQPTFLIADLSNPNLKPWVKERMKKDNDEVLSGKVAFTPHSSCSPAGVPAFHLYGFQPMYFIQTPKEVVIIFSGDKQVRHVYLDVPHSKNPKPSWYGESVGHYEGGDTLVVDTIGMNDKTFVDNFRTPHTEKLHVTERIKLAADGRTIEAFVKVDDPDTFNEPLYLIQRWRKVPNPLVETVCAENNEDHFNQGLFPMPRAKKPDF